MYKKELLIILGILIFSVLTYFGFSQIKNKDLKQELEAVPFNSLNYNATMFGFDIKDQGQSGSIDCLGDNKIADASVSWRILCENTGGADHYFAIAWKRSGLQKSIFQKNLGDAFLTNKAKKTGIKTQGNISCLEDKNFTDVTGLMSVKVNCTLAEASDGQVIYTTFLYFYPSLAEKEGVSLVMIISSDDASKNIPVFNKWISDLKKPINIKSVSFLNTSIAEAGDGGGDGGGDGSGSSSDSCSASGGSASSGCGSDGASAGSGDSSSDGADSGDSSSDYGGPNDPVLPAPCQSSPNSCSQVSYGIIVNGSCNVGTPPNPNGFGNACTSPQNLCGMTTAGNITCNGSCSASVAPSNTLCPPPTLTLTLNPTTIKHKGDYSLKYHSTYTTSCNITYPDGAVASGPTSYDWGTVSGTEGPASKTWTVSCAGINGTNVSKTATLTVKSMCDSVNCPIPKDPCETNPASCEPDHKYVCNDGVDNDSDGKVDAADPGCSPFGVYIPKYNTEINKNILCLDTNGNPIICPVPTDPVCTTEYTSPSCSGQPTNLGGESTIKIVSFQAVPKLVRYGEASQISWKVEGLVAGQKCKLAYYDNASPAIKTAWGDVTTANSTSNKTTGTLTKKTNYTLTCGAQVQEATVSIYSLFES